MKKIILCYLSFLCILCTLTGCSDIRSTKEESNIDVDLTVLSSVMIYSEVYNMIETPEEYVGKTIKVNGIYYCDSYASTIRYYHFLIIEDATACCSQGLVIISDDDQIYPEQGANIELVGVFDSYMEDGILYYYIAVHNINSL